MLFLLGTLFGALLGTLYGILRNRPERNRWTRAFGVAILFGLMAAAPASVTGTAVAGPIGVLSAVYVATLTAVSAATLTELLRELVKRFG